MSGGVALIDYDHVTPADETARAAAKTRRDRNVSEVHAAVISIKRRVFIVEVRDEHRYPASVKVVA